MAVVVAVGGAVSVGVGVSVSVGVTVGVSVTVGVGVGVGSSPSQVRTHVACGCVPVSSTPTTLPAKSQRIDRLTSRAMSRFGRGICVVICRMTSYPSLAGSTVCGSAGDATVAARKAESTARRTVFRGFVVIPTP